MNHTDRDVLDVIRRYSVKFGAAHLKHDTVAKVIGKSNTTARRAIRKLVQLGIINRIHYVRPVMNGLGANIYAIRTYNKKKTANVKPKQVKPAPKQDPEITHAAKQSPEPTTFFGRMKKMLTSTIGEEALSRRLFGIYRQLTIPMLKFSIHEHKTELLSNLVYKHCILPFKQQKERTSKICRAIIWVSYVNS